MTDYKPGSFFPSREDLAWAGGLFEGEGSISLAKGSSGKTGIRLAIGMTDPDVLQRFHSIVRVGDMGGPYGPYPGKPHYKPMWHWRAYRFETAQAVLAALWPWLGERRRATAIGALREVAAAPTRQRGKGDRCGRGHLRGPETAVVNEKGHYVCVICRRANEKARRARRNAA